MLPINPIAETRFLCGKSVYLRPFEKKDLPYLYQWGNDPDIRSLTAEFTPLTPSGLEKFWEKVSNEADRVWFTVCLKDGDRPIGEMGLLRMFPAWRSTDLSIILGDKSAWGQGYGTEAINLLLGIIMVHTGNNFALDYRDWLVNHAVQSYPASAAYIQGNNFQAALWDFVGNLVLGAFPKTVSGFSVLLPYPMVIQQGWVGGIVSVHNDHTSRLSDPHSAIYQPSIMYLLCFYSWFRTQW